MRPEKMNQATSNLEHLLNEFSARQPIVVVGAVLRENVIEVTALPRQGGDVVAKQKKSLVGGCALNIALTLKHLNVTSLNAFLVGRGNGYSEITGYLADQNLRSGVTEIDGDNGWCLAMVEPCGERTFITVPGVENNWTDAILEQVFVKPHSLIYLSGYQLASRNGESIIAWLESLKSSPQIVIDFGPQIEELTTEVLSRILALKPIVSLNRAEAAYLGIEGNIETSAGQWSEKSGCTVVVRLDKDGAIYWRSKTERGFIEPYATTVKDTIGAGDSHTGGLLAGLSAGWALGEAVLLGNAIASYVVGRTGGADSPNIKQLLQHISDR